MHRNPTPHTRMHRNEHPQENALESYPSHMNAPKSSLLRSIHRNPTPHTWMHWNHHPSSKCTRFLPLTHECTEIINPKVQTIVPGSHKLVRKCTTKTNFELRCAEIPHPENRVHFYLQWVYYRPYGGILPLTHECTQIVIPQVFAPESYTSHMNAPKSSSLKYMHQNPTPHTWMHRDRHSSGKCTEILPLIHECTKNIIPPEKSPESYPSHMNAPKSSLLR